MDAKERLKRIEGQVRGVMRMIEEGRDCEEVLLQISAIRSALRKVMIDRLMEKLVECLRQEKKEEDFVRTLERLFKFID